ncbi:MAG: hypothetical protein R2863_12520 [Candidatus Kapaibacterium sp.]
MKLTLLISTTILLLILNATSVLSQGCSDAGLCSFNMVEHDSTVTDEMHYTLGLSNTIGIGDESVLINSTGVEFGANYSDFGIVAKIPFTFTSGTLGQTNGLGDLTVLLSSKLYSEENLSLSVAGGVKIATNKADLRNEDDLSMPMVYQTSNGTNDVILLLAANIDEWVFSTGVQIPLNRNENTFIENSALVEPITGFSDEYYLNWKNYQSSRNFKRGSDVMLKIEKYFTIQDDLKFMAGILPVYRLVESIYEDYNGNDITIMNSDGLTLNIIAGLNYKVTEKHTFGLNIGFPVVTREIRADGLTRALVANVDFKFNL